VAVAADLAAAAHPEAGRRSNMTKSTQNFLNETDRSRIVDAVQTAEKTTSGEIVPLVAAESHDYPAAEFNGALALGMALAIPCTRLLGHGDMWSFLLIFCIMYALSFIIVRLTPGLKRLFVPSSVQKASVARAAMTAFHTYGLHRTRDMTGILIYVSIFERRIHVLADKGINDKVPPRTWDEIVEIIAEGIRNKTQGEAMARAVARCGELLQEHFPVQEDDVDELPNLIVEDSPA
jgi:putative membrane protein